MRKILQSTLVIALLASAAIATAQQPASSRYQPIENADIASRRITRTTTITRASRSVDRVQVSENAPRVDEMTRGAKHPTTVTFVPQTHARVQFEELITEPSNLNTTGSLATELAPTAPSPNFISPQIANSVDMSVMGGGYDNQHRWTPRTNAIFQQSNGPDEWRDVCSCTRVDESRFDCRTKQNSNSCCGQDGCNNGGCNSGDCGGPNGFSGKLRTLRADFQNERVARNATRAAQRDLRQASRPQGRERVIGCNKRGCSSCGQCTQSDATSNCEANQTNQPIAAQSVTDCGCNGNHAHVTGQ